MLHCKIGNVRSAKARQFRLKNNFTGNPRHRLRITNQFNSSSLSDLSSQHGGELYRHSARDSYSILWRGGLRIIEGAGQCRCGVPCCYPLWEDSGKLGEWS